MFHYGFFIAAVAYGLLAGIVREILNWNRNKQVWFSLCSTLLIVLCLVATTIFLKTYNPGLDGFQIELFNQAMHIKWWALSLILGGICFVCLTVLWVCMAFFYRPQLAYTWSYLTYWFGAKWRSDYYRKRLIHGKDKQKTADNQLLWYTKNNENIKRLKFNCDQKYMIANKQKDSWITYFGPVLITILVCELLINVFLLPVFDVSLSGIPYSTWLAIRVCLTAVTIPVNILIIYPVYRIVAPSMRYNYKADTTEGLSVPLMMD
jgi:hypothetical protein